MDIDNKDLNKSYIRAKSRVEKLKKYYSHLISYLFVNILLSSYKVFKDISRGDTFEEAIFDGNNFSLWFWWGIGIAFHTYNTYSNNFFLMSKSWEDKKIKEFMNEK
ncbi:MAG: 2TM domain-containing protein [Flavobacteriaceae bacterium]